MAHYEHVTDAIERIVATKYPDSSNLRWLNNKPSGPKWRMDAGAWRSMLRDILSEVGQAISPCGAPNIDLLGDTLAKPLHETRTLIESKIVCAVGVHQ
jgi:hypothetical protein